MRLVASFFLFFLIFNNIFIAWSSWGPEPHGSGAPKKF